MASLFLYLYIARNGKIKKVLNDGLTQCEDRCILNLETGEITPLVVPSMNVASEVNT